MRFAVVITGIILATSVVSFIGGYKNLVEHASVNYELALVGEEEKRLEATLPSARVSYNELMATDEDIAAIIQPYSMQETLTVRRYRRSATFYLEGEHSVPRLDGDRAFLVSLPDALKEIEVGHEKAPADLSIEEIPVFLDAEVALLWNIRVGDILQLVPYWEDALDKVPIRVVGLGKLSYQAADMWQDKLGDGERNLSGYATIPMFVSDEVLFRVLPKQLPRTTFERTWRLPINSSYIIPETLLSAGDIFSDIRQELSKLSTNIRIESLVPDFMVRIERKLFLAGVPIVLIGIQVGVVAFIYVMAIGVMFWERQEKEFRLLTNRGAKGWALLSIPASQICLCILVATVLGPIISLVFLMGLHFTPMFELVSLRAIVGFGLEIQNFVHSLTVACLGFTAMLTGILAQVLAQRINFRQKNRETAPTIFRYNLDIGLLVIIIPVMWELLGRHSIVSFSDEGAPQIAFLAYVLPIGISIVVGLLFIRVLPLLFSMLARLVGSTGSTVLYLGTISMSRGFSSLRMGFLLLGASVSVLVFSLSLGDALRVNMEERALYDAGADIRIGIGRVNQSESSFKVGSYIAQSLDASYVSPVYRGSVSDISSFLGETFQLLAIDPISYANAAWYRDDFFEGEIGQALPNLSDSEMRRQPLELPADISGLGITVTPDKVRPTMNLMVRLNDANGVVTNHSFGVLDFTGTRRIEVDLASESVFIGSPPHTLLSLYVQDQSTGRRGSNPGTLYLDNLEAFNSDRSERTVLSTFDDPKIWGVTTYPLEGREVDFDVGSSSEDNANRYGVLSWQKSSFFEIAGISTASRGTPLRAWVSPSVVEDTAKSSGDVFIGSIMGQTIPIEIVGGISYFPTVDIDDKGLVLVDINEFKARWLLAAPDVHFLPNEFWMRSSLVTEVADVNSHFADGDPIRVLSVVQSSQLLENSKLDPVVLGGWEFWVILACVASFAFTVAGIITIFAMQVDRLRNTFFVLRSLGLSSLKAYSSMVLDVTLICCMSVVIGVLLGNLLQLIMVPMINVDVDGSRILPPVVATMDWGRSGYVCLGVVGALVPLMICSQMWLAFFQKAQTLRLEEL